MTFELIKSETLLQGRVFRIRRDTLKTPDGRETKFEIIEHGGSVVVIPVDEHGDMYFVRQYRHAAGWICSNSRLARAMVTNHTKNAPPARSAKRQAWRRGNCRKVGEFFLAPGYSSEFMEVYLATHLKHNPLEADEDEFLSVEKYPVRASHRNGGARRNARRQVAGGAVDGSSLI
jgi:hypothetical protein